MEQRIPSKICGREFDEYQLDLIKRIIELTVPPIREQIARRVCSALNWLDVLGREKTMSCKVALLRLHRLGLIELPQPIRRNGNGRSYRLSPILLNKEPINLPVNQLSGLQLEVVKDRDSSQLWNYAIGSYHYLGYKPLSGAQQRYVIHCDGEVLGCVGFSASAWTLEARDKWIGWDQKTRERNLHLIINNSRFLILPWVRCHNLGSKVVSLCACRIRDDFYKSYGYCPVLLETFVEAARFSGRIYKAANWKCIGTTKGRGKLDRYHSNRLPLKDIYVYPLCRNFRSVLRGEL